MTFSPLRSRLPPFQPKAVAPWKTRLESIGICFGIHLFDAIWPRLAGRCVKIYAYKRARSTSPSRLGPHHPVNVGDGTPKMVVSRGQAIASIRLWRHVVPAYPMRCFHAPASQTAREPGRKPIGCTCGCRPTFWSGSRRRPNESRAARSTAFSTNELALFPHLDRQSRLGER